VCMLFTSRASIGILSFMTEIQRNLAVGIGIAALLGAGVYYYATRSPLPAPGGQTATSTPTIGGIGATGDYTVEEVEIETPPPTIRPVIISADLSAEARAAIVAHFEENKKLLAKDPYNFNAWLDLAILYKIGGDYRGAEAIWLYATKAWPTSPIAYNNLGDLYQNFLKDPLKAKFYYDQAAKLKTP